MVEVYDSTFRVLCIVFSCLDPTVHVWAGISEHGRTGICVLEGILKELLMEILDGTLLPFVEEIYP